MKWVLGRPRWVEVMKPKCFEIKCIDENQAGGGSKGICSLNGKIIYLKNTNYLSHPSIVNHFYFKIN